MPIRKRQSKRKVTPTEYALMFVHGDGVRPNFGDEPVFANAFLARAAWNLHRTRAWAISADHGNQYPPEGAVVYDGLDDSLWWGDGHDPRIEHPRIDPRCDRAFITAAARRGLDGVAAFRMNAPTAAEEIAEHLERLELVYLAAEEHAKSSPDELIPYRNHFWALRVVRV